jgi:hypothetical protein
VTRGILETMEHLPTREVKVNELKDIVEDDGSFIVDLDVIR